MKTILTVREILSRGIWSAVCDLKGIDVWAVNEGLINATDTIELSEEEARKLFLIE